MTTVLGVLVISSAYRYIHLSIRNKNIEAAVVRRDILFTTAEGEHLLEVYNGERKFAIEEGWNMPEISLFRGIRVTMYYDDHNPPHFHAEYASHKCMVDVLSGCVIKGMLPARQLKLVLAWNELHREELMQNWELAKRKQRLIQIDPL